MKKIGIGYDRDGNVVDNSRYFDNKKIMNADKKILDMMGKYPVINLSLKAAKQPVFLTAFKKLRDEIINEYRLLLSRQMIKI